MKKILFLAVIGMTLPVFAYALGGTIPFGGFVTMTHVPPNVLCPGGIIGSPFWIIPQGVISSPGPWSTSVGINVGLVVPGAWIIGKYRPAAECIQSFGVEAHPFPTFQTDFYGTSIPKPVPVPFL